MGAGADPSGALHTTYHVPKNETIENDWCGVRWTRRLKNGRSITFDYSLLSPALLIETDADYFNISIDYLLERTDNPNMQK